MIVSKIIRRAFILVLVALYYGLHIGAQQVAFLSDPHIQDVVTHPELLRSMDSQVQSTRLFNENVFAFKAALDDVAKRGIKFVVISGDITDDGQIINMEAARNMLNEYETKFDIRFFVTPGNHDPSSPFGKASFMKGMLAKDGSSYTLVSDSAVTVPGYSLDFSRDVVNPKMYSVGHKEQMAYFGRFGYYPREDYLYWETPFSKYKYENYTFEEARASGMSDNRMFTYCKEIKAYDTSYLVEPVEGLWLLSIDSGVYLPDGTSGKYKNSGVGYNNTMEYKPHLVPWIKHVYAEASRLGKRVVAFSHFPLLDFNDGASEALANSWGRSKFDIERIPNDDVTTAMADAGIGLHFAGHMHIFDTAKKVVGGHTLNNIQIPALITAVPAYLVLSLDKTKAHIDTVLIKDVDGFDTFFANYRQELEYLNSKGSRPVWNTQVLQSKNYSEFCDYVFRDLVRTRFAVRDLPKILHDELLPRTGKELLRRVNNKAKVKKAWGRWTGDELLLDFYRLHYSGSLALQLIPQERLTEYQVLFSEIRESTETSEFMNQMRDFATAFNCFLYDTDDLDFSF